MNATQTQHVKLKYSKNSMLFRIKKDCKSLYGGSIPSEASRKSMTCERWREAEKSPSANRRNIAGSAYGHRPSHNRRPAIQGVADVWVTCRNQNCAASFETASVGRFRRLPACASSVSLRMTNGHDRFSGISRHTVSCV
jgi:hypothetical protein